MDIFTLTNRLADDVDALQFSGKVACVYNPLRYAEKAHTRYLERFSTGRKRILFLGMNPGPWGMAQIGVPFGEINAARDWLGIHEEIGKPENEHPKRPVQGFDCQRSEVSGRRLWGLFSSRFATPEDFFRDHYVANYCPLVFMEDSGKNFTPDKLPKAESAPLYEACDRHLTGLIELLEPEFLIGVGNFALKRLETIVKGSSAIQDRAPVTASILHPSPASPAANRGWDGAVLEKMYAIGAWQKQESGTDTSEVGRLG